MKIIYETRVKSIILDKLSLYYMGLRPIFNEIAILESMPDFRIISFQWINFVYLGADVVTNGYFLNNSLGMVSNFNE